MWELHGEGKKKALYKERMGRGLLRHDRDLRESLQNVEK